MTPPKKIRVLLLILALSLEGNADQASAAYKRGTKAEAHDQYDTAYQAFREAHGLKPKDPKYFAAYVRARFYAAVQHVRTGQQLEGAGKFQEALQEFQLAAQIDDTNFVATEEARKVAEVIRKQARGKEASITYSEPLAKIAEQAEGPVELEPLTDTLINLKLGENVTFIYKTIGKLAGINVLFDADFKPQKVTIELNDVTLKQALDAVALQSKTFWQATASNTILVAADTPAKRKELQNTVMKTFYLRNISTPAELQEAANTLKSILDINRIQLIPTHNALVLRGTTDQMVLAELLLEDIDKPKPEVVVDVAVLQVSRNRMLTLGAVPPSTVTLAVNPAVSAATTGSGSSGTGSSSGSSSGSSGGSLTLNSLRYLNATNFVVSIPPYSFTAITSDNDTKLIQKPEIWALDNEKATLKIGDRIPIATGSFGATGGTQGYGALVNTQFQYIDVGVNIDITPHIHSDREVTLKMTLEISSVTGSQNIGGITQPIIGQRRVDLESRIADGEINLVGGILEDTETHSLSGYPGLAKLPILKYLFAQDDKQRQENEIVFAIMPHIVRSQELTDENLRLVDVGAGNSVTIRRSDSKKSAPASTGAKDSSTPQSKRTPAPGATAPTPSEPPANSPAPANDASPGASSPQPIKSSSPNDPAESSNPPPTGARAGGTSQLHPPT
jgi:general secretion pathway protein D